LTITTSPVDCAATVGALSLIDNQLTLHRVLLGINKLDSRSAAKAIGFVNLKLVTGNTLLPLSFNPLKEFATVDPTLIISIDMVGCPGSQPVPYI
jgi:hypothetical protein